MRCPRLHWLERGTAQARRVPGCGTFLAVAALLVSPAHAAPPPPAAGSAGVDARLDLLFGEHDPYRAFLHALQAAVAADDRRQVATMVSYPLTTKIEGHLVHIRTTRQFLGHYDELLPPATRKLIATQSFEDLFVNSQGVMVGSGQLWFSGVCSDELCSKRTIKLTAFNPTG